MRMGKAEERTRKGDSRGMDLDWRDEPATVPYRVGDQLLPRRNGDATP